MRNIYTILLLLFIFSGLKAQVFSGQAGLIPDDLSTIIFEVEVSGLPDVLDTLTFGLEQLHRIGQIGIPTVIISGNDLMKRINITIVQP